MKKPKDVRIDLQTKDINGEDADNKYCAVVLGWDGTIWYNTGIVVREDNPLVAVQIAIERATLKGWWI